MSLVPCELTGSSFSTPGFTPDFAPDSRSHSIPISPDRPFKARVPGSSPGRLTIKNQVLARVLALARPLKTAPCAKFVLTRCGCGASKTFTPSRKLSGE